LIDELVTLLNLKNMLFPMPNPGCLETTGKCYKKIAEAVARELLRDLERYRANVKHGGVYKIPYFILKNILKELNIELCPPLASCHARFGAVVYWLIKVLSNVGFKVKRRRGALLIIREKRAVTHPAWG
jgi:hypothetical protein